MRRALHCLLLTAVAAAFTLAETPSPSAQWKIQYFYDKDDSEFKISDLRFMSPQRGIAIGMVVARNGAKPKGLSILTRDGGQTWTEVPLREVPTSMFFLNESLGWMVTDGGIWQTNEGGRDWRKIKNIKRVQRVRFVSPEHGWAIGAPKLVLETKDGGRDWKPVEAAQKPSSNPEYTSYNWIEFANDKEGVIVGSSVPPRAGDMYQLPNWLDPERASTRREWPSMTLSLETRDGGVTWESQTSPTFGQTSRVRLAPDRVGLLLVRFSNSFEWPAEVYLVSPKIKGTRVFRDASRIVTDVALANSTHGFLAAIQPTGKLYQLNIPGKLRILQSTDLVNWTEMKVDYKATATSAILAVVDSRNAWVATDEGMILRLMASDTPAPAGR